MVKITYIGRRTSRRLRNRKGNVFNWSRGDTRDIEDESLLEKLKGSKVFVEQKEIGPKSTGGGIKTHVRPPKRRGRPSKSKAKSKKEIKSKTKPPKGLRKKYPKNPKKRAD